MPKKYSIHKIITILSSASLILLIFLSGTPPVTAVYLSPGTIETDEVMTGSTVIFRNVTLTIRSNERIPIDFLEFSVFNSVNNQQIGYTEFGIKGNKIRDQPSDSFIIIRKTPLSNDGYGYGYNYGYDENYGYGYDFGFDYGYGYGNPSLQDITIIYDIIFTTNIPGTYYATFAANCSSYEFVSDLSESFFVISQYPPIPQKQDISPPSLSAVTGDVNISFDFIDLEGDLDHLNLQISGPAPYDIPENYISWTFMVNEANPWDGWSITDIFTAQDMGVSPAYNQATETWTISIDSYAIWNNPNPWVQPINSSVWPAGGYNFSIEVVDALGNTWGSIADGHYYSTYFYSFHSIQPAIDQASQESTVYILNGTFHDQIIINKNIHLIGSGSSILQPDTIPQSGVYDVMFHDGSSGSVIEGLIFDFNGVNNTRSGLGLSIGQAGIVTRDITIKDNIFYPGDRDGIGGFSLQTMTNSDVSGLLIKNNMIYGNDTCNGDGIIINPFYGPDQVEIYHNEITGNISNGIIIQSSQIHVSSNILNNTGVNGLSGISFLDPFGGMSFTDVTIVSNIIQQFENGIVIGNPINTGSTLTAEILSNTISENDVGILVRFDANLQNSVHFNNILNNVNFGMNNIGGSLVNGTYNWWGHPSGPYHSSNPSGLGNPVSNNILFSNWLTTIWNNTAWIDDNYDSSTPGWGIDHFNTTAAGINAVFDGGFVLLNPGTYYEVLFIDKPLTLQAKYQFTNSTVISDELTKFFEFNAVNGQTIQIASDDVFINGLKIERVNDVSFFPGPAIGNTGYPDLYGIGIINCTIQSIYDGVYLSDVEDVAFIGNKNITAEGYGVHLESANNTIFTENTMENIDSTGLYGEDCHGLFISNNTFSHKLTSALHLSGCNDVYITDCDFMNNTNGISLTNSEDAYVFNSTFKGNQQGISLFGSTIADINDNIFENNNWNYSHVAHVEDYLYYGTIQNAVLGAGIGTHVYVYQGNYFENVIIDKKVILKGADPVDVVVIDGEANGPAISVGLNNDVAQVTIDSVSLISDMTALKTGTYKDVSGLLVKNCIIETEGNDYAVSIDPNQFSDFPPLRNGTNPFSLPVQLKQNLIRGGILFQYHPFEIYGVDINTQLFIEENDIDLIRLNGSISVRIINNDIWSIIASSTYDLSILDNRIVNDPGTMKNGVNLWSIDQQPQVNNVMIRNNSIVGFSDSESSQGISGAGVLVAAGYDVTIDDNEIFANSKGILVTEDCTTEENTQCLGNTSDIVITKNDIEIGQTAIMLMTNVSDVLIDGNNLSNNGQGIWLRKAFSNIVSGNSFIDHYYGIRIDMNSSHNLIYNNYFMDNDIHAQDPFSYNTWNTTLDLGENIIGGNRLGGNYWDNYEGMDTDGDYIGDTLVPHTDNAHITNGGDFLPLMIFDNVSPMVEVLYPNGGEVLNNSVTIRWIAEDDHSVISNVKILYSDDAGLSWILLSDQEENDGEYLWDITTIAPGENYSIKIEVEDLAGNKANDTSDDVFGIDEPTSPGIHVEILHPIKGWVYFFNKPTTRLFPQYIIILGHIAIESEVESTIDLDRIELYVDEQLMKTWTPSDTNRYFWNWDERALFFHTVTIKAYDIFGHMNQDAIDVIIFNLDILP